MMRPIDQGVWRGVRLAMVAIALLVAACGGDDSSDSSAKTVSSFAFLAANNPTLTADVDATIVGADMTITVPFGTDVTSLVATFAIAGKTISVDGTVQVSGITANDFSNPVDYRITAKDGSAKDYTATVTVAVDTAKAISALAFLAANNTALTADVTATLNATAIAATVPYGTNVTALVATFATDGASVSVAGTPQVSGTTANDFTSPVMYKVVAADGSAAYYTVTVTIAANTAKAITAFAFLSADNGALAANVTATITDTAIAATVPYGTDVSALAATFSTTGASVTVGGTAQVSGTTANNFATAVTYHVTAADGSTQNYTVTVTIALNSAKAITAFGFTTATNTGLTANVTATIVGNAITATVYGTTVTGLHATYVTTGAMVKVGGVTQMSGMTANDFTSAVTYRVYAADATFQDYTVTITSDTCTACTTAQYQATACDANDDRTCTACTTITNCMTVTCTTSIDQSCSTCDTGYRVSSGACVAAYATVKTYTYTDAPQSFTVPAGITSVRIKAWGGGGGGGFVAGGGGGGGFVQADLVVAPGDVLTIYVAGGGGYANTTAGGYPNGQVTLWSGAGAGAGASYVTSVGGANIGGGGGGGAADGNTGAGALVGGNGGATTGTTAGGGLAGERGGIDPKGNGGAGGNNATTGGTNTTSTAASGTTPGGSTDTDYAAGVGIGGAAEDNGTAGYVVLRY